MRARVVLFALVPALLAQHRPPLSVQVTAPAAGVVDADLVVPFTARVSDPSLRTARLMVNGMDYEVPVHEGAITQTLVAVPGNNRVAVSVARGDETATDATTFYLRGARTELIVLLGWPAAGEIIDLWVREPDGQTCKWDQRTTTSGGRLLDFSTSAIGFGAQAYATPRVHAGRYRVKVHYWAASAPDDVRTEWTRAETLGRLDGVIARLPGAVGEDRARLATEQRALEDALDRWSLPGAPQTVVRAEVVLLPNTPWERRWRFDRTVDRTGQLLTLGEIEVDDALLTTARRGLEGAAR